MRFRIAVLLILLVGLFPRGFSFDAHVSVPSEHLKAFPGGVLRFEVSIKNINETGRKDFGFEYFVKRDGVVILKKKEIRAVETQASFLSTLALPEDIREGEYVLEVRIKEGGSDETKEIYTNFVVENKKGLGSFVFFIGFAILAVALVILLEVRKLIRVDEEIEEIEFKRLKHN